MAEKKQVTGSVFAVNISEKKGTKKVSVPEIILNARGVLNDAHAGMWDRQVSMLAKEAIDAFIEKHQKHIGPGSFAENLTVLGIDFSRVKELDRFIAGTTELEVTRLGKSCHGKECAIFQETGDCIMPDQGIFLRVVKEGKIKPGDQIMHYPRIFRFKIITLSDKCFAGETEDISAPEIKKKLEEHFAGKQRTIEVEYKLLPDKKEELKAELLSLVNATYDVIFTTGGTGVSPRDITPDVVLSVCDKVIPGIMEYIRTKYGQTNPHALISRSVAGVIKQTLVFAMPGSLKAVQEYMAEILTLLEHLILMTHGLGH